MANGLNKQVLIGNIGQIKFHTSNGGNVICNFCVATGSSYRDKQGNRIDETTWHNCVAFSKIAEIMQKYCSKGKKVYIEGQTKHETYEKDGDTKYITKVIVNTLQLLSPKDEAAQQDTPPVESYAKKDEAPFDDPIPF